MLHRDSVSKTAASLGIAHLETRNYVENSLLGNSSPRLTESQLGFNHGRRIGNAFVNVDVGWQRGIGAFAQHDRTPFHHSPEARYNKYSLTASYLQSFQLLGESFSVDSLVNGQHSEDVLYSPQRISVGGLSSVRGFKEQSLSGDTGAYWRNQLRWRRPVTWAALQPFVQEYGAAFAYDLGVIHGDRYNPARAAASAATPSNSVPGASTWPPRSPSRGPWNALTPSRARSTRCISASTSSSDFSFARSSSTWTFAAPSSRTSPPSSSA